MQGAWYYQYLAGIQNSPGSIAFQNITVAPQIVCSNLSSVSASMVTHRGPIESAWACIGGSCVVAPENVNVTLSCPAGVIQSIDFASFGTATGSCPGPFELSSCNANDTISIVSALCLGKPSCTVFSSDTVFGDPCFDVVKHLAISASCESSSLSHSVTIPVGSSATVVIPLLNNPIGSISESGTVFWVNGAYVPGVTGITNAALSADKSSVNVSVGSGSYNFLLF
jgi:hypothetical protein